MRHFARGLRLRQIKEIQIRGHAHQHRLHEIKHDQGVEVSGFLLRVEDNGHGQGNEPETENQVLDPRHGRGPHEIVVDAETLSHQPQRVRGSGEAPERTRHSFGATAGLNDGVDENHAQRELNQVRK